MPSLVPQIKSLERANKGLILLHSMVTAFYLSQYAKT